MDTMKPGPAEQEAVRVISHTVAPLPETGKSPEIQASLLFFVADGLSGQSAGHGPPVERLAGTGGFLVSESSIHL